MVDARAEFESAFAACPLIAILRGVRPDEVIEVADLLISAGFTMIEVPLNSPDPFDSIARLVEHCAGRAMVGAGTVMSPDEATRLGQIGARLMVTPTTDPLVIEAGIAAGLAPVIGCLSPTEAVTALRHGAVALKVFPANALGAGYARDLKAVLPAGTRVLAVGGVGADTMAAYHAGGYDGFGLGGSLYAPGREIADLRVRAEAMIENWSATTSG